MCLFLGVFEMPTICPIALILSIFSKCQSITKLTVGFFEKALRMRNAIAGWKYKSVSNILTSASQT